MCVCVCLGVSIVVNVFEPVCTFKGEGGCMLPFDVKQLRPSNFGFLSKIFLWKTHSNILNIIHS